MTRLTPVRCDICGEICYLEEESLYLITIKGQNEWTRNEELTFDACSTCKDKVVNFISKLIEKSTEKE